MKFLSDLGEALIIKVVEKIIGKILRSDPVQRLLYLLLALSWIYLLSFLIKVSRNAERKNAFIGAMAIAAAAILITDLVKKKTETKEMHSSIDFFDCH